MGRGAYRGQVGEHIGNGRGERIGDGSGSIYRGRVGERIGDGWESI